jgi:hypothetical protein
MVSFTPYLPDCMLIDCFLALFIQKYLNRKEISFHINWQEHRRNDCVRRVVNWRTVFNVQISGHRSAFVGKVSRSKTWIAFAFWTRCGALRFWRSTCLLLTLRGECVLEDKLMLWFTSEVNHGIFIRDEERLFPCCRNIWYFQLQLRRKVFVKAF